MLSGGGGGGVCDVDVMLLMTPWMKVIITFIVMMLE